VVLTRVFRQSKVAERYEVTRPLGEGGFGKAFVVLDKQDFRQYVLKQMDCESEEEAVNAVKEVYLSLSRSLRSYRTRVENIWQKTDWRAVGGQMVLLRLMKHPYIVGYRDFWRDNLKVYIVMEYCEGGDMALLIEQQHSHFPEQVLLLQIVLKRVVLAAAHPSFAAAFRRMYCGG
jgi:serine/threonine protein kinase